MQTTTWNGEWKPTLRLTSSQMKAAHNFGIADIAIDGIEVRCWIYGYRGQTFANQSVGGNGWFQLTK
jgi:hypothetical protein